MERIIQKPQLSKATTKRLSLYLRYLKGLEKMVLPASNLLN